MTEPQVNVDVSLVQCQLVTGPGYAVLVTAGDYKMLAITDDNKLIATAERAPLCDVQVELGRLLHLMLSGTIKPKIVFKELPDEKCIILTVVFEGLTGANAPMALLPVDANSVSTDAIKFKQRPAAEAYAGDLIEALSTSQVDWTKLKITADTLSI